jgi:hypothetical protein
MQSLSVLSESLSLPAVHMGRHENTASKPPAFPVLSLVNSTSIIVLLPVYVRAARYSSWPLNGPMALLPSYSITVSYSNSVSNAVNVSIGTPSAHSIVQ